MYLEFLLGKTTPSKVKQDLKTGSNDVIGAKAAMWNYAMDERVVGGCKGLNLEWERQFGKLTKEFSEKSKFIDFFHVTESAVDDAVEGNFNEDMDRMVVSGILVVSYTIIVLGGCSPVHFRTVITFVGLGCIFLAVRASEHIPIAMGFVKGEIHIMIPFLLLGVGVDDMFVICNAVD
jgi:hypothetical protein